MALRKAIPNSITSMNLLCGVMGVIFTFNDRPDVAFCMMLAAAVFDFLDGKIARHEETRQMLDIIFDGSVYDFGMNFSNQANFLYTLPDLMKQKSTDIASYIKKNIKVTDKMYDRVLKGYEGLNG